MFVFLFDSLTGEAASRRAFGSGPHIGRKKFTYLFQAKTWQTFREVGQFAEGDACIVRRQVEGDGIAAGRCDAIFQKYSKLQSLPAVSPLIPDRLALGGCEPRTDHLRRGTEIGDHYQVPGDGNMRPWKTELSTCGQL